MSKKEILKTIMPFVILFFIFLIPIKDYSEGSSDGYSIGDKVTVSSATRTKTETDKDGNVTSSYDYDLWEIQGKTDEYNLYCIAYGDDIGKGTNIYTVSGIIKFDDFTKAELTWKSGSTTYKASSDYYLNRVMAYLSSANTFGDEYTTYGYSLGKGQYTPRQWALWNEWNKYIRMWNSTNNYVTWDDDDGYLSFSSLIVNGNYNEPEQYTQGVYGTMPDYKYLQYNRYLEYKSQIRAAYANAGHSINESVWDSYMDEEDNIYKIISDATSYNTDAKYYYYNSTVGHNKYSAMIEGIPEIAKESNSNDGLVVYDYANSILGPYIIDYTLTTRI